MQVQRATTHHHQTPESELIALARKKGQVLMAHTLRLIEETLESRGVSLAELVETFGQIFGTESRIPAGF